MQLARAFLKGETAVKKLPDENGSSPLRILQIIGVVCGGGVENVVMNYYRHIDKKKIQFDFVIDDHEKSLLDDEIEAMGGKIYHIRTYKENIVEWTYEIYKIVKENQYEIVHVHMNTLSVFPLLAAWLAGSKTRIAHNHSTAVKSEKMRSAIKYLLRPFTPLFANRYAACSKLAGEWMFGKNATMSGKVRIIHNAIDRKNFAYRKDIRIQLCKELDISEKTFVVGHVGRFMYQKNHEFLLEVFKSICKEKKDAVLLMIGDGELREKIEKKVKEDDLDRKVRFLGVKRNVKDYYNVMDSFVFPSRYEGLGLAVLEAEANGLPCIVSERVSKEVKITEFVTFVALEKGPEKWAEQILSKKRGTVDTMCFLKNGYDIEEEAKKLVAWYEELKTRKFSLKEKRSSTC